VGKHTEFTASALPPVAKTAAKPKRPAPLAASIQPLEPRVMLDANLSWEITSSTAITSVLSGVAQMFDAQFDEVSGFLDQFDSYADDATHLIDMLTDSVDGAQSVLGSSYDLTPATEAVERIRAAITSVQEIVDTSILDLIDGTFATDVAGSVATAINGANGWSSGDAGYIASSSVAVGSVYTIENLRDGTVSGDIDTMLAGLGLGAVTGPQARGFFDNAVSTALGLPAGNLTVSLTDIDLGGDTIVGFAQNGSAVEVDVALPQSLLDLTTLVSKSIPGLTLLDSVEMASSASNLISFDLSTTTTFAASVLQDISLHITSFNFAPLIEVGGAFTVPANTGLHLGLLDLDLTTLESAKLKLDVETSAGLDIGFTVTTAGSPTASWLGTGGSIDVVAKIQEVGAASYVNIGTDEYKLAEAGLTGNLDFGGTGQGFTASINLFSVLDGPGNRLQAFLDAARFDYSVNMTDGGLLPTLQSTLEDAITTLSAMGTGQFVGFLEELGKAVANALRDSLLDVNIPLTDMRIGTIMDEIASVFTNLANSFSIDPGALGFFDALPGGGVQVYETLLHADASTATAGSLDAVEFANLQNYKELTFSVYGPDSALGPYTQTVDLTGLAALSGLDAKRAELATLIDTALTAFGFASTIAAGGGLRIGSTTPVPNGTDPSRLFNTIALTSAKRNDNTTDSSVNLGLIGFDVDTLVDAATAFGGGAIGQVFDFTPATSTVEMGTMDLSAFDGLHTLRYTIEIDGRDFKIDVPSPNLTGGFATLTELTTALNSALDDMGIGITAGANTGGDGLKLTLDAGEARSLVFKADPDDLLKAVDIKGLISLANEELDSLIGSGTTLELTEDGELVLSFPDLAATLDIGAGDGLNFDTTDLGLGDVTGLSLSAQISAHLEATLSTAIGIDLVGLGTDLIGGGSGNALEERSSDEGVVTSALLDNVFLTGIALAATANASATSVTGSANIGLLDVSFGSTDATQNFVQAAVGFETTLVGKDSGGVFGDQITLRQLQSYVTGTPTTSAIGIEELLGRFELLGGIVVDGGGQGLDASSAPVTTIGDVQIVDPFTYAGTDELAQLLVRLGDVRINVLGISGINEGLIDGVSLSVGDLSDISNTWDLALLSTNPALQDAIDGLAGLESGDILDTLTSIANILVVVGDTLSDKLPFLNVDIPLLNFSVLDQIAFARDFLQGLQEVRNNPQGALDSIHDLLEDVFGANTVTLEWDAPNKTIKFELDFHFLDDWEKSVPFQFDLQQILGAQLGALVGPELADVVSGLVDVSGDGELVFDPTLSLVFAFGIDLSPTLVTPSVLATTATRLEELATVGSVNHRPDDITDLRIVHANLETGVTRKINIDTDGTETLGDLMTLIQGAIDSAGWTTVSINFDASTGQITLTDSIAFATDSTGLDALIGGETASADDGGVQKINVASGFSDWAGQTVFAVEVNGEQVNITVEADAGRDRAGFITAFNAALDAARMERQAVSGSAITGMTISMGQLFDFVDEGGTLKLITTNFAQANGYDPVTFTAKAADTSVGVEFRLLDLGGANFARVLGFGHNLEGQNALVSEVLFQSETVGAPRIYLDTAATGITASFVAGVNDGLNVKIGLGPIEVQVIDGKALINSGNPAGDPAYIHLGINDIDGDTHVDQYDLSHLAVLFDGGTLGFEDLFNLDVAIALDINLPFSDNLGLFNPAVDGLTWTTPLLQTLPSFSLANVQVSDLSGELIAILNGTGIDLSHFHFNLPDLASFLDNLNILNILNDPRLVLGGVDMIMGQMQKLFDQFLSGIDLPVVGAAIGEGVTFFQDFRYNVIQKALDYARQPLADGSLPTTVDLLTGWVNETLNDLFGTSGMVYMQAYLDTNATDTSESYIYGVLNFNGTIFDQAMDIGFDLGIPGFNLAVERGSQIRMQLTYGVNIGFGYDKNGFFLLNDTDNEEVSLDFLVDAGSFEGSMKLFNVLGIDARAVTVAGGNVVSTASDPAGGTAQITASLTADLFGNTGLTILDPGTKGASDPYINGTSAYRDFSHVTLLDAGSNPLNFEKVVYIAQMDSANLIQFDFSAAFDIQIQLEANVLDPTTGNPIELFGAQVLPSVMTEVLFNGTFDFTNGLNIDQLMFNKVRLDASVLYDALLAPILDPVKGFIAPAADFFAFLSNPPVSYISDILGNVFPIIKIVASIINVTADVLSFVNTLTSTGGMVVFGDFDFSGNADDIESGQTTISKLDQRDISRNSAGATTGSQFGLFGNPDNGLSIEIPLLTNPFSAINILSGNFDKVDLVRARFTLFNLDTGVIDIVGLVLDTLGAPGWVNDIISSAFSATIEARLKSKFEVGYDMSGIVNFVNSFDPERLLDGIFIDAEPGSLIDAYIGAALRLNLGIAGLTAEGHAGVKVSFNDIDGDGKLRIPELIALLEASSGLDVFGYLFKGEASFRFFLSVWAGISLPWPLPDLKWSATLFDFDGSVSFGGLLPPATIANDVADGEVAVLNIGARAGASYSKIKTDGDDTVVIDGPHSPFNVSLIQNGVTVTATINDAAGGIIIPAGEGNNVIDLHGVVNGVPTITYTGAGIDRITLPGSGVHVVFAGDGTDTIDAAPGATGTYIIFGEGGADTVNIDGGNVIYFGDSDYGMRDRFLTRYATGAPTGVTDLAADILDQLDLNADGTAKGTSTNYLVGSTNSSLVTLRDGFTAATQTSGANDVEHVTIGSSGSGNHMVFTGAGADTIAISEAATGTVFVYAGDGADVITAGGSSVFVEGGGGRDFVKVEGTSTEVWGWAKVAGESGLTSMNATIDALAIRDDADMLIGGSGTDKLYGQVGRDILEGRDGADTLSGGLDNDIITGGLFSVRYKTGEPIDILTFDIKAPLTKAIVFGVQNLADGNDSINGGRGDDLLLGGGGSDHLSGLSGNDILIGDFGEVTLSATWVAERVLSTFFASANSGTDVLDGAEGNDILMAGSALPGESETLIDLLGDNIMIGDFADITGARVLEAATYVTSLASSAGGADSIQTGRGNDMILGGEGDDTVDSGRGGDIIIGDTGTIDIVNSTVTSAGAATDGNDSITIGNDPAGAGDPPSPADLLDLVIGGRGNDTVNAINGGLSFIGDGGTLTLDPTALNALRTFRPAGTSATPDQLEAQARTIELVNFIARETTSTPHADDGNDTVSATGGQVSVILGGGNDSATLADGVNYVIGDDGTITLTPSDDYSASEARLTTKTSAAASNNDSLTSGAARDLIIGGEGDDTVSSGASDDMILGDSGEVVFDDRDPADVITTLTSASDATDGHDRITATDGRNRILAGGGNDTVVAGNGGNLVLGDSGTIADNPDQVHLVTTEPAIGGADDVTTGSGNDLVILGAGSDTANLGDGDNTATGDNGEITFNATGTNTIDTNSDSANGNDTITSGTGQDHILAGLGDDSVDSGAGRDLILGDMGNLITEAGLTGGRARFAETTQHSVGGADTILSGDGADVILAGAGGDSIASGADADVILGDDGDWTSSHIDGLGTLQSAILPTGDNDTIDAGAGDDIAIGSLGDDSILAGAGDDEMLGDDGIVTFRADTEIETLDLTNQELGGNDTISALGTGGDNILVGQAGSDLITGGNDDDLILGDLETLVFDPAVNRLPGQSDLDRLTSAITIRPDLGFDDQLFGGSGSDMIMAGFGDDDVHGGDGQDILIGDAAIVRRSWVVAGGELHETMTIDTNFAYVDGGYDELHGDSGADIMIGNLGPDLFYGNTADDLIFSDGYAGIFSANWHASMYQGPTGFRNLLTSNFAGPDAIDVVSNAQQDNSIGNPLSIGEAKDFFGLGSLEGGRNALSAGASDLVSRTLKLLESDTYIAAIVALIDAGTDRALLDDALFTSLAEDIGAMDQLEGISYELLLRRLVELFLNRLIEIEGGDVTSSLSVGTDRSAA